MRIKSIYSGISNFRSQILNYTFLLLCAVLAVSALIIMPVPIHATDAPVAATATGDQTLVTPAPSSIPDATLVPATDAPPWLLGLVVKYPWIATFISIIGICRMVAKPVWSAVLAVVKATPTTADDKFLDEAEHTTWWKYTSYVIDWFFSIKLGPQATSQAK